MLVRATDKYEKLEVKDIELGRIPKKGEEFEVSKERFKVLTQTNKFNEVFIELVEDEIEIEEDNIIKETELKENEVIDVKAKKVTIKKNTKKKGTKSEE